MLKLFIKNADANKSNMLKPGSIKRKTISTTQADLMHRMLLMPPNPLPLLIEPAREDINFISWVTNKGDEVTSLFLLDCPAPVSLTGFKLSHSDDTLLLTMFAVHLLGGLFAQDISQFEENLRNLLPEKQLSYVLEQAIANHLVSPDTDLVQIQHLFNASQYERNFSMKVLIFGGTGFLGRHIVEAACSVGHEVTLFNRGKSHPELFPELEQLRGDVDGGSEILRGRSWDAAIDTCSMFPRVVRSLTTLLTDTVAHYTYISSTSVYANFDHVGIDERYPVSILEDENIEEDKPQYYGGLKALCEKAAESGMPGRVLTIRPGLLVGPFDASDRFTYWPYRIAKGGEVIAPGSRDQPVQFIDVRDIAAWIMRMFQNQHTGVYNAKGPLSHPLRMQTLLEECKAVSKSDAKFVWIDENFLLEHEVAPYRDMPLWVPSDMIGFATVSSQKAIAHGLTYRPLAETIQDTLTWNAGRPLDDKMKAGLKPDREQELLQIWYRLQS